MQVMDADQALQDYKIANNLVTTDKGGLHGSEQLNNLSTQLTNARIAVADAKARLERIQQLGSAGQICETGTGGVKSCDPPLGGTEGASDAEIVKLRSQYRELAARASEIEARVGPGHSAVIELRQQMDGVRASIREEEKRIVDSYASELQFAKARESELAASVARLVRETETSSQALVTMRELESSADTLHNLYDSFLQKVKETNTIQTQTIPIRSASIVTRATPPLHKPLRKVAAVLAGSMLLGLFFGRRNNRSERMGR